MSEWRAPELNLSGTFEGGRVLFCEEVDPPCDDEACDKVWNRYAEISEWLQRRGLRPSEVYLQRDCISGEIIFYDA